MLSEDQKRFIHLFVLDGEYNLIQTCCPLGLRPSVAMTWFREQAFQTALRKAEGVVLATMGLGPLRIIREMMALATSNIVDVTLDDDGGMTHLPRHITAAVKSVKNGAMLRPSGELVVYPKEIVMHDKAGPQKYLADMLAVSEAPEVKATQATTGEDGPKRITGLVVRPPLTREDKDIEDLLR